MTARLDGREDIKAKIKEGLDGKTNDLVENFMQKVYNGEIKNGYTFTIEMANNWCKKKGLYSEDNDFRNFMLCFAWSNNSKSVGQKVIGAWFDEDEGFGDTVKQAVTTYGKSIREGNK